MYDNGLLQYYQSLKSQKGFLDATQLGVDINLKLKNGKVRRGTINGKSYYLKSAIKAHKVNESFYDAEILLSQIYNKAGIESAVYLPATFSDGEFLVSNDVEREDVVLASKYLYTSLKGAKSVSIPFLAGEEDLKVKPTKFYTKQAMQQQTKMRILDAITCNYDRHRDNFFYTLRRPLDEPSSKETEESALPVGSQIVNYFKHLVPNKATDVVAIDFGISGNLMPLLNYGEQYASLFDSYYNDFSRRTMHRDEMIDRISSDENLASLIDKKEFAETLGGINPYGVAQEIQDTIGYTINPTYLNFLDHSFSEMAENLSR